MKNIIPFKKEVIFKTKLGEITSISLENTLKIIDGIVDGKFIINGEYKEELDSENSKPFNLELPFKNAMDESFDTDKAIVDIDDFYYEITDNNTLVIFIDVLVDRLEEKPLIKLDDIVEENNREENIEEVKEVNEKEINIESNEITDKVNTIFNTDNCEDNYVTYNVFIIREGDTIESIISKYNIDRETLEKYNDLSDIKKGDKILIPSETK